MTSFANLKRNSNSFEKLSKAVEATSAGTENSKDDNRFWQPEVDKAGNGMAIIRFLPAPAVDGDDALPWVRVFSHGFQGPGGWFIDNCLTTVNEKCPVCEHNSTLWNSGIEANKDIARKQKRKLSYVANILVISDPSNPANEGQVRLYKFGKKIFDKITEAMNPDFADETPVNPFDMWEGANFKLKIRNVEGYRNYDKSEFADKSALLDGDDEKLEALWKKEFSLKEFTEPSNFKSYDELKARLDAVLSGTVSTAKTAAAMVEEDTVDFTPPVSTPTPEPQTAPFSATNDDDDDAMSYFEKLANE